MTFIKNILLKLQLKKFWFLTDLGLRLTSIIMWEIEKQSSSTVGVDSDCSKLYDLWVDLWIATYILVLISIKKNYYKSYKRKNTTSIPNYINHIKSIGFTNYFFILPLIFFIVIILDLMLWIPAFFYFILVFTIKLLTIIKKYCELKTKNYDNLSLIIKKPLKYKTLQKKELEEVGLKEEEIHSIRHFKHIVLPHTTSSNINTKKLVYNYITERYVNYSIDLTNLIFLNIVYCIYEKPDYDEYLLNSDTNTNITWEELFKLESFKQPFSWRSFKHEYMMIGRWLSHERHVPIIFTPERIVRAIISFQPRWIIQLVYRRVVRYPIFGFKNTIKNLLYITYLLIFYTIKFYIHFLFIYNTYLPLILLLNNLYKFIYRLDYVEQGLNSGNFFYSALFIVSFHQRWHNKLYYTDRIFPSYIDYEGWSSSYYVTKLFKDEHEDRL